METKYKPKADAETATIELKATVAAICYLPADPGSVEVELLLVAVSKSPVELNRQEGNRRSVLLADRMNYLLLLFRNAKILPLH
jgi:hypothetical protein